MGEFVMIYNYSGMAYSGIILYIVTTNNPSPIKGPSSFNGNDSRLSAIAGGVGKINSEKTK